MDQIDSKLIFSKIVGSVGKTHFHRDLWTNRGWQRADVLPKVGWNRADLLIHVVWGTCPPVGSMGSSVAELVTTSFEHLPTHIFCAYFQRRWVSWIGGIEVRPIFGSDGLMLDSIGRACIHHNPRANSGP